MLRLRPAPRILSGARERVPDACIIGFKAEHGVSDAELERAGERKLAEDRLDVVVANDVARPGAGFATETNDVVIVWRGGRKRVKGSKERIAREVLDLALELLKERRETKRSN